MEEALELLDEYGADARVLAGGQSLAAMLNMRLVQPRLLIDISGLPALATIEHGHGAVTVGASVTQAALLRSPALAAQPLLGMMLPWVGHMQTRERGNGVRIAGPRRSERGSCRSRSPCSGAKLRCGAVAGSGAFRRQGFRTGSCAPISTTTRWWFPPRFPVPAEPCGAAFREVSPRHGGLRNRRRCGHRGCPGA